jgi:N-acetyl-anhydromuramyl-L-alanine amidase AmpD
MFDLIKYGEFEVGDHNNKIQIILLNTLRDKETFLNSVKYRFNGKNQKIPNYLITREGKIIQLLENTESPKFFLDKKINQNSIIVCLENLGWLQKEPLNENYINWIGDIYKGNVFEKKWRDYFFWEPYSEIQIEATAFICKKLFEEISIKKQVVGHNTKINGAERTEGVLCRSNFSQDFTDVNPSFDFELFLKYIEDEQFT